MALIDDILATLTTAAVIDGSTWTGFGAYTPAVPDQVVIVTETGGPAPDQTPVIGHDFKTFQIRVRGAKEEYDTARTRMQAVFDALNDATISGYVYVFAVQSGAMPLGNDEKDRPIIGLNFQCMVAR